jgi:hypothetical protein
MLFPPFVLCFQIVENPDLATNETAKGRAANQSNCFYAAIEYSHAAIAIGYEPSEMAR